MIGRLTGRVVHEEATGSVILDVRGVGYELLCPVGTMQRSQRSGDDGDITLFVHTNLRQDALDLFGFCSLHERTAFRQLTHVPNVGPKLALSVLNVLPASELAQAIDAEDKARLSKVPGVGKKTAERLVLELRGKLARGSSADPEIAEPLRSSGTGQLADRLMTALTGLGYRPQEAERATHGVLESGELDADLSSLLRKALQILST